jgi:hypothetical protein
MDFNRWMKWETLEVFFYLEMFEDKSECHTAVSSPCDIDPHPLRAMCESGQCAIFIWRLPEPKKSTKSVVVSLLWPLDGRECQRW